MQIDMIFKYIFGLGPPGDAFIEAPKKDTEFGMEIWKVRGLFRRFLKNTLKKLHFLNILISVRRIF